MKQFMFLLIAFISLTAQAQDKTNYVAYNKLTILEGTTYVLATVENRSKMRTENKFLLFINTLTGESRQIDFPKDAFIEKIEQVKIDSFNINKLIISANTVNLDGNKSIDWNDPKQIIVCSTDGKEKTQITEDKFFASFWVVNRQTGVIVITGYTDTNNNGKYDRSDKNEIIVYDLKKMSLIKTIE